MRYTLCVILFLLSFNSWSQTSIEEALFNLEDVSFKPIDTPRGFDSAYELKIKQALDHKNPDKGYFYQRVFLSHRSFDAPTAIITNGYGRPGNRVTEVADIFKTNQISVEHRYFLESSPDSLNYDYLNFEQVTADLHKINQLFKKIYSGKWISTGISKGGTTTIFYRYFYPNDVDVSIPYVAPVNHSDADPRIYSFLDSVGTADCREDILAYQKHMLQNAEKYKPYLKWFIKGKELEFNYLSFDEAYEYAVLEYPFSFWQYGHDCSAIPDQSDNDEEQMQYLLDIVGFDFYSDADMESYASHYYQSGTEMGYYGFETDDFEGLIKYLDTENQPSAVFMPNKMPRNFDGTLTNKVFNWTKTANNMVYINGAIDTWSATAAPKSETNNSLYYFMDGKHHGNARIRNMVEQNREELISTVKAWLQE